MVEVDGVAVGSRVGSVGQCPSGAGPQYGQTVASSVLGHMGANVSGKFSEVLFGLLARFGSGLCFGLGYGWGGDCVSLYGGGAEQGVWVVMVFGSPISFGIFVRVVPSGREYGGEPLRSQPSVVASVRPRSLFVRRRYVRLTG